MNTRHLNECLAVERLGRRCLPIYYTADVLCSRSREGVWDVLVLVTVTDEIVGFAVLGMHHGTMVVMSIGVDSSYRRMGGCSALLRRAQSRVTALELHVKTDNVHAMGCYTKNGFRFVQRIPNYYRSLGGEDAYRMRWVAATSGTF